MCPSGGNLVNVLCLALKVNKEAYLPSYWFERLEQVPLLRDACLARYQAMGTWLRPKAQEVILEGIYTKVSDHEVACIYDTRPTQQKYKVTFGDYDSLEITDPWDLETSVKLEKNGRAVSVTDMYREFKENEVNLPPVEVKNDWLQYLHVSEEYKAKFVLREDFATNEDGEPVAEPIHIRPNKKRRVSEDSSRTAFSASGDGDEASGTGLSAALSSRLRRLS